MIVDGKLKNKFIEEKFVTYKDTTVYRNIVLNKIEAGEKFTFVNRTAVKNYLMKRSNTKVKYNKDMHKKINLIVLEILEKAIMRYFEDNDRYLILKARHL